jgi:polysaccharide biosynthesis protein PslH
MQNIVFTSPILNHPTLSGPDLRIENSLIALSKIANVHLMVHRSWMRLHALNWGDWNSNQETFDFYNSFLNSVSFPKYKGKLFSILFSFSSGEDLIISWKKNFFLFKLINLSIRFMLHTLLKFLPTRSLAEDIVNLAVKKNSNIIWFGYGNISYDLMTQVHQINPRLRLICDTDSVWSRFILRELPFEKFPERRSQISNDGKLKQNEEASWVNFCDVTTAVSEIDQKYYLSLLKSDKKVMLFSNVVNLNTYSKTSIKAVRNSAIFLGGSFGAKSPMDHASRWFIDQVFGLICEKQPDARLNIVGRGSDIILKDIQHDKITIHGTVESILPIISQCSVSVVPLFFESGTRFKILESGACKIPVVSTTLGAEGLDVENRKHLLLADKPSEFANCILEIMNNRCLSDKLTNNLYTLVKSSYSINSLAKEGKKVLAQVV